EGRNLDALVGRLAEEQAAASNAVQQVRLTDDARQRLRKYLFAAWNGEAVSQLASVHPSEVRRFTNQWKPVQTYYAIYFHLVALQYSLAGEIARDHAAAMKYGTLQVSPRLPIPWRLRLDYEGTKPDGFPNAVSVYAGGGWNLGNIDPFV